MTARTHPTMPMTAAERFGLLHPILGDAPIHLALAIVLLTLSIAGFLAAPALGIAMTFVMTLALTIALPASIPLIVIAAFVFQNTIIAAFTPLIVDNDAFDMARGVNFVVLVAAFGAYLFVSFIHPQRILPLVRPWLRGALAVLGVVMFYLVVGAVRGETMDAVIYFRNTLTPIACFYIALLAASWYRVDLSRGIV
ncbi:MAG: hypothetical protein KDJ16_16315, partial [Hyphomicrobiales bacterium]|nr:hypothetical protein [Hyphomicrobiales bacterium]